MVNFSKLRERVQWLRGEDGVVKPAEAERVMAEVLDPLLFSDGYELRASKTERGMDWIARRPASGAEAETAIAIEYKHNQGGRPLARDTVERLLQAAHYRSLDRILLIARHGFAASAHAASQRDYPIAMELFTLDEIDAWVDRAEAGVREGFERVEVAVRSLAHELALTVAACPFALYKLEWRHVEEMIGRILNGLGFDASVTPPSKDGGKDVIAECHLRDGTRSYIVELKHWRSGKQVGSEDVTDFVKVVAREKRDGGVFLSTSGFREDAFSSLTEVVRQRVRFGGRHKIVALARSYERVYLGLWSPPSSLPQVLFESTE